MNRGPATPDEDGQRKLERSRVERLLYIYVYDRVPRLSHDPQSVHDPRCINILRILTCCNDIVLRSIQDRHGYFCVSRLTAASELVQGSVAPASAMTSFLHVHAGTNNQ
jgi:hypothetical protein